MLKSDEHNFTDHAVPLARIEVHYYSVTVYGLFMADVIELFPHGDKLRLEENQARESLACVGGRFYRCCVGRADNSVKILYLYRSVVNYAR